MGCQNLINIYNLLTIYNILLYCWNYAHIVCVTKKNVEVSSGATSFSRNVISSNLRVAEMQFCRIVVLPKQNIAESHLTEASHGRIVELAKLHNAERHFFESLFSRTSFFQIIVQPNVIFTNRRLPNTN